MQAETQPAKTQHKFHHSNIPYEILDAEAAKKTRAKFQRQIESGRAQLPAAIAAVQRYAPKDRLIEHPKQIGFVHQDKKVHLTFNDEAGPQSFPIHDNALSQLAEKADIPWKYARRLRDEQPDLLTSNLSQRYAVQKADNTYLARFANGELMGWLSDSFGLYDTPHLLEGFLNSCRKYDAVPVEVKHTGTVFVIKMVLQRIFEPIQNEILAFGIQFRTSDFGRAPVDLREFLDRCDCTNLLTGEQCLRRTHLGEKLTIEHLSEATKRKKAEYLCSLISDHVDEVFSPTKIAHRLELIKVADEQQIKVGEVLELMKSKSKISKDELGRIKELLVINNPELLPPVRTLSNEGETSAYRFANALSLLAQEDGVQTERALELEQIAGEVIGFRKKEKVEA